MMRKYLREILRYKSIFKRIACLMLIYTMIVSCKSLPPLKTAELPLPHLEPPIVTLGPGDAIDVKYRYWPELDLTQTVRHDGMISLMLVDDVQVTGLTPEHLDDHLTKLYEGKIIDPDITVIVQSLASQNIYVGGEVSNPGAIPLDGEMNVLEAIMAAGGYSKKTAELSNVLLIQHVGDKRYVASLDMKNALNEPESYLYYLSPHDIVFVPQTRIDKINVWVDTHFSEMIPDMIWATKSKLGISTVTTFGVAPNRR